MQTKAMAKLNFGGVEENVVTHEEFPLFKAQQVLENAGRENSEKPSSEKANNKSNCEIFLNG